MVSFFFLNACEKNSLQTTNNNFAEGNKISQRQITDCDDCGEDCCCGIELVTASGSYPFRICGTSSETGTCGPVTPPIPCSSSSISGGGASFTLTAGTPKFPFCMLTGTSFYIQNLSTVNVSVWITCQDDVVFPQRVQVTIPANGGFVFIDVDGSCEVGEC